MGKLDLIKKAQARKENANGNDEASAASSAVADSNCNIRDTANANSGNVAVPAKPFRLAIGNAGNGSGQPQARDGRDGTDVSKPIARANPLKAALAKAKAAPAPAPTSTSVSAQPTSIGDINMDAISATKPIASDENAPNLENYLYEGQAETAEARACEAFYEQLQIVEKSIGTGFASDNINTILKFLDEHSFLKGNLKPEDIGIMVRVLRNSYENAINTQNARGTKKKVAAKDVSDVMSILTDIGI